MNLRPHVPRPLGASLNEVRVIAGFTGPLVEITMETPREVAAGLPPEQLLRPGESYRVDPGTGWVMFRSGVLYDPASQSLVFQPNSDAPGSPYPGWLEDWSRFVTQTSFQMQRQLMRRPGVSADRALSVATTEAEERMIGRLEGSPQAEYLQESFEENTRLRDGLAAAVAVARSLGG